MAHLPTDHSDVPIRLFKSDFLEFFSHISPIAVLVIWVPVVIFFLVKAFIEAPQGVFPYHILLGFVIALFLWTLAEYVLHRFLFHMPVKGEKAERIVFLFHGVHHAQPQCKTRLVMPPVVAIPLAAIFFGIFYLIFGYFLKVPQWIAPVFAGFLTGYLVYDMIHYATHHFAMRKGYLKYIKRYHMQHHYKTPDKRFGVSSPLWDMVFNTKPE